MSAICLYSMVRDAEDRKLFPSGISEEFLFHVLNGGKFPNEESENIYKKISYVKLWEDENLIKPNYRKTYYKHYYKLLFYLKEAFIFYINGEIEAGNEVNKTVDEIENLMLAEVMAVNT